MWKRRRPFLWLGAAFLVFAAAVGTAAYRLAEDLNVVDVQRSMATLFAITVVLSGLLFAAVWKIGQFCWLKPAKRLAVELRAVGHGDQRHSIDITHYGALPDLPEAINDIVGRLADSRQEVASAVAAATANVENQKARLAAILNDLHEGVVVCNLKHQVVLYNQVALGLLRVCGEMGLGRSLSGLVAIEPVLHSLDLLLHRPEGAPGSAPFITGPAEGRVLLQGRMSLVRAGSEVTGYVITFSDVTESVSALAKRDALLREVIESLRAPVQRLTAPGGGDEEAASDIGAALDRAVQGYRSLLAGWWPMTDIHSGYLFGFVIRRLEGSGLKLNMTGLPLWLHGDSHSLVLALDALVRAIAKGTGASEFDLAAEAEGGRGWICVSWRGTRVDDESLIEWQKNPVPGLGGMIVRDVMRHHTREDLIEEAKDGVITLRIQLPLGREGQDRIAAAEKLPPRPEFFDFDLLAQGQASELGQVRLRDLTYVVFDTETTGLFPTQGDQVVSIAGVRIVNGRILTGETFNRIVNPGRRIPAESVKFHGITDQMVVDKPPLSVVLPQFKSYVAGAVLIAHNAAFDLKFIRLRERECGVSFDNPVLDTMLLSSFVDGTPENQSLDAIAERYGVTVADRHTALGDSLVTAAVLLHLIDALEVKGIRTLDEALTTLNMTMELHNRVQAFM